MRYSDNLLTKDGFNFENARMQKVKVAPFEGEREI